jgi:predicted amidophosphoribosyltransferase
MGRWRSHDRQPVVLPRALERPHLHRQDYDPSTMACPACGFHAAAEFAFCPQCGQRLAMPAAPAAQAEAERRPATVMFADLSDSPR